MCQRKPAPRCANHARAQLAKAREALTAKPNDPKLLDTVARAQHEYDLTPTGRDELQAEVERLADTDPVASAEVQKRLDALNDEYRKRVEEASLLDGSYTVEEVVLLAEDATTTPATLAFLAPHWISDVRIGVAENPTTPVEVLARLASDEDKYVRGAVADNPNTPVETLVLLTADENYEVRAEAARNPSTPVDVLVALESTRDEWILSSVAVNPSTPVDALARLASNGHEWVRFGVAENPNTPVETLTRLTSDENEVVRVSARSSLSNYSNAELLKAVGLPVENADSLPREWVLEMVASAG